ncbi:Hypothetical predicted protein, partial [Pelobates cultripes]
MEMPLAKKATPEPWSTHLMPLTSKCIGHKDRQRIPQIVASIQFQKLRGPFSTIRPSPPAPEEPIALCKGCRRLVSPKPPTYGVKCGMEPLFSALRRRLCGVLGRSGHFIQAPWEPSTPESHWSRLE